MRQPGYQGQVNPLIADIERTIARLTGVLQGSAPRPASAPDDPRWQVVVVGEPLNAEDFQARESAREHLRLKVQSMGIRMVEHIWLWDETGRAQLVVAAFVEEERALRLAQAIRDKGLEVRVVREQPRPDEPN